VGGKGFAVLKLKINDNARMMTDTNVTTTQISIKAEITD